MWWPFKRRRLPGVRAITPHDWTILLANDGPVTWTPPQKLNVGLGYDKDGLLIGVKIEGRVLHRGTRPSQEMQEVLDESVVARLPGL